jgi:hypothetical protein
MKKFRDYGGITVAVTAVTVTEIKLLCRGDKGVGG